MGNLHEHQRLDMTQPDDVDGLFKRFDELFATADYALADQEARRWVACNAGERPSRVTSTKRHSAIRRCTGRIFAWPDAAASSAASQSTSGDHSGSLFEVGSGIGARCIRREAQCKKDYHINPMR